MESCRAVPPGTTGLARRQYSPCRRCRT
jgi:hypothetical protein